MHPRDESSAKSTLRALVTGASGPIGAELLPALQAASYAITRLTRKASAADQVVWDPAKPLDPAIASGYDAVIHLSGESVMGRWTEAKKSAIRDSRVLGTRHLAQALAQAQQRPRVLICASAIGYYGNRGDEILTEESPSGSGFLPEVCRSWEAASQPAEAAGIRIAHVRMGVVLSAKGGALSQMLPPFRLGLGGQIGSGRQWLSWIHVQDLIASMLHIIKNDGCRGPFNGVGPTPVTNAEFTKTLASVLSRPAIFPVPVLALHALFGKKMADETLLSSARVAPRNLLQSGFQFQYPQLREALAALLA